MAADIQPGMPATEAPAARYPASVTLAPDQKSLSILFDQYVVEAGNGRTMDRKSCNIAIPVRVPQGYSISVFQIDYRGFNSLPAGARSQFNVEYPCRLARCSSVEVILWPCFEPLRTHRQPHRRSLGLDLRGADTNLRVNTSMLVQSNRRQEQAMATVDSADVTAGLVYHIAWRTCR